MTHLAYNPGANLFDGNAPVLTVADPALVKRILVKDFDVFSDRYQTPYPNPITGVDHLGEAHGADWRRMRAVWSAMFTGAKLRHLCPTLADCVAELVRSLEASVGAQTDLVPIFERFAMDALWKVGFSVKCGAQSDHGAGNVLVSNYNKAFNTDFVRSRTLQAVWQWMLEIVGVLNINAMTYLMFFMQFIRRVITDRRRQQNDGYNDFIECFMKSVRDPNLEFRASGSSVANEKDNSRELLPQTTSKYLTESEVSANGWLLLISGTETITSSLSFVAYELARNPDVQRRLRYEIVAATDDTNGNIGYDALTRLPYLDAVLSETLRLHSPFHRVIRTATRDYTLPGTGISMQRGQKVEVPVYAIHNQDRFFPNSEHFDPGRFLTDRRPTMYMPFGVGPRNCVAGRFAMLELKMVVAQIVKCFTLEIVANADVPVPLMNRQEAHKPSSVVKRDLETGSPVKRVDFLQLMLDAMRDDNNEAINGSEEYTDSKSEEKYKKIQATDDVKDKSLSYDELIAQCVMFLIAGYENTSTTLSLCLYSIAKHPEVQQKLYEEIHTFHEQKISSADSYETINSLKYMNAVIDETLRLFSPLMYLNRVATEDYELKGTGIIIKKGHEVHIPTYPMHRDPEYFTDPQVFRPERFLPENIAHNPYTYLPFGAGPRSCIGMRLAQLEFKLALVNLIHRYVFHATQ
ncbi:unnamed protein product, partial [Oppiella nova]